MKLRLTKTRVTVAAVAVAAVIGGGASIAAASSDATTTGSTEISTDAGHSDGETADGTDGGPGSAADGEQADGESQDGPDGGPGSDQEEADPSFTGSVPAPAETEVPDGQETSDDDAGEQAALAALATVTPSQAEQAALATVPGTVAETDLDSENGFVVYSVEVNGTDGTVTEVTVDAGSGEVLAQQAQDATDPQD